MNGRTLRWLLLSACLVASAVTAQDIDLGKDVSEYRRFLIYPHLHRGFQAMEHGDRKVAIAEFERARQLAPRNPQTAAYLADAYQRFGMRAEAERLLAQQGAITPDDPRFQRADVQLASHAAADADAAECDDNGRPLPGCSSQMAYRALHQGDLATAQLALHDPKFAQSQTGIALRRDIAQRAIHLGDAEVASAQFQALQHLDALEPGEARQWLQLLLDRRQWARAIALQREHANIPASTSQSLHLARLLADADQQASLRSLLAATPSQFESAGQEQEWFDLLRRAWPHDPRRLARYQPHHMQVRQHQARVLVPLLLADGAGTSAERLLQAVPEQSLARERLALALMHGDTPAALRRARAMLASSGNDPIQLDALSYQLMQSGADAAAAQLLLDQLLPVGADKTVATGPGMETVWQRLAVLASRMPAAFDAGVRERLATRQPVTQTSLALRSRVVVALQDCDSLLVLAGDLSLPLEAQAWRKLGQCWQDSGKPGLAQYGYQRAWNSQPDAGNARLLAMQAYTATDYPLALGLWDGLQSDMDASELQSAVRAAIDGDNAGLARTWLSRWARAGGERDPEYWWLRAEMAEANAPAQGIIDLDHALALDEQPRYWQMQARLHQRLGQHGDAVHALSKALAQSPDDDALLAELGYAQLRARQPEEARSTLLAAARLRPDDSALAEQLAYLAADAGDNAATGAHLRAAIDAMAAAEGNAPMADNSADADRRFALRREHEQRSRRLTLSADLLEASAGTPSAQVGGSTASYRSFGQLEAGWRLLNGVPDPETLTLYARVFAGSGERTQLLPHQDSTLGVGVRWKPLRRHSVFLAMERQQALDGNTRPGTDTMLRVSASLFGNDRFSDDWHPRGEAWLAQNLYLDVAHLTQRGQTLATADYRLSQHRKLRARMTFEPFGHLQWTASRGAGTHTTELRGGAGVRWNLWYDEDRHNAWRHRISIGLERQYALKTDLRDRHAWALSVGGRW